MGEGPAFIKLLGGIVGMGALAGCLGGFFSGGQPSHDVAIAEVGRMDKALTACVV